MKPWKLYAAVIGIMVVFGGGLALGYRLFSPAQVKTTVSADVILTALRDRGFLVTQTYLFDEPVTIRNLSGNGLKDFFFGQTITARGVMEANLGIDLSRLSVGDIAVEGNAITVTIPKAVLFNVRPVGPIDVKNEQGILKRLFENDTGYNQALTELSHAAEDAAKKVELVDRATEKGREEIVRLLGYVTAGKEVRVVVKK